MTSVLYADAIARTREAMGPSSGAVLWLRKTFTGQVYVQPMERIYSRIHSRHPGDRPPRPPIIIRSSDPVLGPERKNCGRPPGLMKWRKRRRSDPPAEGPETLAHSTPVMTGW